MATPSDEEIRAASRGRSRQDHAGTVRAYFPYWDVQVRPYLVRAVETFTDAALDWRPRPEVMTAREMIAHIAEAERWWIAHGIDGEPYADYVVPLDENDNSRGYRITVDASSHAALLHLLDDAHRPTQRWLDRPDSELEREIVFRPEGMPERRFTLQWALARMQEHEIHHRAQLYTYLRLQGLTPPLM